MISIIVATINRVAELERLLCSLEEQHLRDFEVIVVDQNPDARLLPVLSRHAGLAVQHQQSERGLSRARNAGLRVAKGEIVAFPDDDCWYPNDLLASVAAWFESHCGFEMLGVALRTVENAPAAAMATASRQCVKNNVSKCVLSATLFMRKVVWTAIGGFNENLGAGAPSKYQAGEERDYVWRALEHGFQMWYEPALTVHHPSMYAMERQRTTTYPYALCEGRVQRMHHSPLGQVGGELIRSFGGAAIRLCQGDLPRARVCLLRGAGQLVGYVSGPRNPSPSKPGPSKRSRDTTPVRP